MPLNNPKGGAQWTDEHCDELKRLAALGRSYRAIATEINAQFGTSYSRNATIGKAGRMGLAKEAASSVRYADRPRKESHKSKGIRAYIPRRVTHNSDEMHLVPVVEREQLRCVDIVPLNLTTAELPDNGCQYIPGDYLLHCGHPRKDGSSYCVPHHFLCWRPTPPRHDRVMRRVA